MIFFRTKMKNKTSNNAEDVSKIKKKEPLDMGYIYNHYCKNYKIKKFQLKI